MKLVYFADGPWAQLGLEKMVEAGHWVKRIYLRHNQPDNVLGALAEQYGIDVKICGNVNDPEALQSIRHLDADIGVSLSFNQIIKPGLLNIFPKGMINIHAGKLPMYRGRNVLNWALINGEKEIGVTCHYINAGIDSGDIILQRTFPVESTDDYGSVLNKAIQMCPDVLVESLDLIERDEVIRTPQSSDGTYFIGRMDGDEFIDWSWPSEQIFNFVRAITTPGPGARSWLLREGRYCLVIIYKTELVDGAPVYQCVNGGIVGITADGCPIVKTGDTILKITDHEIRDENRVIKLKIGDRLGVNLNLLLQKIMGAEHHERLSKQVDL